MQLCVNVNVRVIFVNSTLTALNCFHVWHVLFWSHTKPQHTYIHSHVLTVPPGVPVPWLCCVWVGGILCSRSVSKSCMPLETCYTWGARDLKKTWQSKCTFVAEVSYFWLHFWPGKMLLCPSAYFTLSQLKRSFWLSTGIEDHSGIFLCAAILCIYWMMGSLWKLVVHQLPP